MDSATVTTKQEAGKTFDQTVTLDTIRHDPPAMRHAPLRTLLYADADGDTRLAAGQPSLLFASYGDPRIAYVGHELDALLARLIILLGGGLPLQLAAVYASGNDDA